jgi:hypothetical protein
MRQTLQADGFLQTTIHTILLVLFVLITQHTQQHWLEFAHCHGTDVILLDTEV